MSVSRIRYKRVLETQTAPHAEQFENRTINPAPVPSEVELLRHEVARLRAECEILARVRALLNHPHSVN